MPGFTRVSKETLQQRVEGIRQSDTPILVPVIEMYGIDKIHFGVLFVITVLVGSITPPVGTLLYLGCSIAGTTVSKTGKEVWPFVFFILLVVVVGIFVPQLVTFLPDIVFGRLPGA